MILEHHRQTFMNSRANYLSLLLVILVISCKTSQAPTNTISFDFSTGLNSLYRGMNENEISKELGTPEFIDREWEQQDGTKYFNYYDKGIQILTKDGLIQTIFLYFRSKRFKTYSGKIAAIHKNITIDQIKKILGEPDRISRSIVSKHETSPGAKETYLSYEKNGAGITFYDEKLADIRFFRER